MNKDLDNKAIKVFNPNELKEKYEKEMNNTASNFNETLENKNILSLNNENEKPNKEEDSFSEIVKNNNLFFEEKQVSFAKLYIHLSEKYEIILMILGTICALGSGVAAPLMCYLFGDMANDFSSVNADDDMMELMERLLNCKNEQQVIQLAGDNEDRQFTYLIFYNQAKNLFEKFDDEVDKMVTKLMIIGASMFFAFGLSKFLWNYIGMRQMHHLKEKYFSVILRQEQGWFDANNVYEFSTKVQAQFEQISLGVGDKFGLTLQTISMMITGIIIAFYKSWLLTLVMLSVSPLIFACVLFLVLSLKKPMIGSRKSFEKAGGMAEEMLYNIKTVSSFSNFEFEIERYNKMIDIVHKFNEQKAFRLGLSIGSTLFFVFFSFFIAALYSRKLLGDEKWNDNSGTIFTLGDIVTVVFSTLIAILSIGVTAPNIKIIQESSIASSDYFTLYEREPQMDFSKSVEKPPREKVKGKIEFKDICFYYPSDKNKRMILKNLNIVVEHGKKVALVGESGCGKSTTVNLLERLYEATSGEVLIDGINIKNYNLPYLRSLIGYVQQEPVLFNKSLKENLIFGREEQ